VDVKLIVTYDPAHTESSKEKVELLFKEIGLKAEFLKSKYSGIFLLNVAKPREAVKKLKDLAKKSSELFGKT
jgi:hypothetical protein